MAHENIKEHELDERGMNFALALRESIGDRLADGLFIRPKTDEPYEVEVDAMTNDSAAEHQTAAIMHVTDHETTTRFLVGSSELTRSGARQRSAETPQGWVSTLDGEGIPQDGEKINSQSRMALLAMHEVQTALDSGEVTILDRQGSLLAE